jgi:hypothetical protein
MARFSVLDDRAKAFIRAGCPDELMKVLIGIPVLQTHRLGALIARIQSSDRPYS